VGREDGAGIGTEIEIEMKVIRLTTRGGDETEAENTATSAPFLGVNSDPCISSPTGSCSALPVPSLRVCGDGVWRFCRRSVLEVGLRSILALFVGVRVGVRVRRKCR
jgi:hypothetical protein